MKKVTGLLMIACCMPFACRAADVTNEAKPGDGEAMLALLALIACAAVVFGMWNCYEWIGAKANEAKERARKMKLENDKLEREINSRPN